MDYCDTFVKGLCEKTGLHLQSNAYCRVCPYYHKPVPSGERHQTPERPKPTVKQMAAHFTKAMFKWGREGFQTVTQEEYQRRRSICNACSGGWRCPHCGCMLWAKAALATEVCDKWS